MNNYISQFAELLRHEAPAINGTAQRLQSEQIERAVELLVGCVGKVALTGIGKSGFMARKVAATLSTGTGSGRGPNMIPLDKLENVVRQVLKVREAMVAAHESGQ